MNKKRLLALADFLDELPPKRFDFSQWVGRDWKGSPDLSCGTTACAIGWCPQVPMLKKIGVRIASPFDRGVMDFSIIPHRGSRRLDPEDAARVIFDLSVEEVEFLFVPMVFTSEPRDYRNQLPANASAKRVAKRIRDFVAGRVRPEVDMNDLPSRDWE